MQRMGLRVIASSFSLMLREWVKERREILTNKMRPKNSHGTNGCPFDHSAFMALEVDRIFDRDIRRSLWVRNLANRRRQRHSCHTPFPPPGEFMQCNTLLRTTKQRCRTRFPPPEPTPFPFSCYSPFLAKTSRRFAFLAFLARTYGDSRGALGALCFELFGSGCGTNHRG